MDWRWDWLWSIFWNAFIHAITFNWTELARDGGRLKDWWRSLWGEITDRLDNLKSWASGKISWLTGYAGGLVYQLGLKAAGWVNDLRNSVASRFSTLWATFWGKVNDLYSYAYSQYTAAIDWARRKADAIGEWATNYARNMAYWVKGLFDWVQPYRDLITNWLVGARGVIDWLWYHAWRHLQAFLADPKGWVLRELLGPLINLINRWAQYGSAIMSFITEDLPNLRNLLARGFSFLMNFLDRPGEIILELLAPIFLEWVAGLIADNW